MAKLYSDLITECVAFPYSSEYFDMMKESAEIGLQATYLECQAFSSIHMNSILESKNIDKSYFIEAIEGQDLKVLEENFIDTVAGHAQKIWKGFINILNKFINFLTKCVNLFDEDNTRAQIAARELIHMVKKGADDSLYEDLDNLISDSLASNSDSTDFMPYDADNVLKVNTGTLSSKFKSNDVKLLSAGLTNGTMRIDAAKMYKSNGGGNFGDVYAISPSDINKVARLMKKGKVADAKAAFVKANNDILKNGLKIVCTGSALKKTIGDLQVTQKTLQAITESTDINDILSMYTEGIIDAITRPFAPKSGNGGSGAPKADPKQQQGSKPAPKAPKAEQKNSGKPDNGNKKDIESGNSKDTPSTTAKNNEMMDSLVAALVVAVGLTLRAYNDYVTYRKNIISGVEKIITKYGGHLTESVAVEGDDDVWTYESGYDAFYNALAGSVF